MKAFCALLYTQVAEPSLFMATFLGLPQAALTWSIVMPTTKRCSIGRLSFFGLGGGACAVWVVVAVVWAGGVELWLELEAQPQRPANATVETITLMLVIFFMVITGFHLDCPPQAIFKVSFPNH